MPDTPHAGNPPAPAGTSGFLRSVKWRLVLWSAMLVVSAALVLLKYVYLPSAASAAVATLAEGYGLDMTVEDWSADLLELTVRAEEVAIRVAGRYSQEELLTVDEIELDLSLGYRMRTGQWTREVRLREPQLYLERLHSGRWNWEDMGHLSAALEDRRARGDHPEFTLQSVRIEKMGLAWVENLPSRSGDGILREERARLFLDDIEITADDVMGLLDPRPRASRLMIEARTGDGRLSFNGRGNFFRWGPAPSPQQDGATVVASSIEWLPSFSADLYLENVGAGVLTRLTPNATLLPTRGAMSGTVKIDLASRHLDCLGELELQGVGYAANPASPVLGRNGSEVERHLRTFEAGGRHVFDCGGDLRDESFRPIQGFQSQVTRSAVQDAPTIVRAAAAIDHAQYTGAEVDPQLAGWVQRLIGGLHPDLRQLLGLPDPRRPGGGRTPGRVMQWGRDLLRRP